MSAGRVVVRKAGSGEEAPTRTKSSAASRPTHSFIPVCCHVAVVRIASSSCCCSSSAILCSSRSSSLASASLMLLRSGGEVHIDCRGPRSAREALRDEEDDADEEEEAASDA